jgi:hypothetical protein
LADSVASIPISAVMMVIVYGGRLRLQVFLEGRKVLLCGGEVTGLKSAASCVKSCLIEPLLCVDELEPD